MEPLGGDCADCLVGCCWLLLVYSSLPMALEAGRTAGFSGPDLLSRSSVGLGAEHLGPKDRLVQLHLPVELLDDRRVRLQVDDRVDALGLLVDLVGETTTAPGVDLLDLSVGLTDHGKEALDQRGDCTLLEIGVED